jgi:hypothetical protein
MLFRYMPKKLTSRGALRLDVTTAISRSISNILAIVSLLFTLNKTMSSGQ